MKLAEDDRIPLEMEYALEELALQLKNATSGYNFIYENISSVEDLSAHLLLDQGIQVDLSLPYLFLIRSAPELFFMGDNRSAIATSGDLFKRYNGPLPYLYYSSLASTTAMKAELMRDLQIYGKIHTDSIFAQPRTIPTE